MSAQTLDREAAAVALDQYMDLVGVGMVTVFESRTPGVMAFERLTAREAAPVDWDMLAQVLSAAGGAPVVCVAPCDWSFDDSHDEEATLVAFDVPGLDDGYRDDPRNELSAGYMAEIGMPRAPSP